MSVQREAAGHTLHINHPLTGTSFHLEAVAAKEDDPDMFPIVSPHLAAFPSTYIAVCGADPLCDDGRIMNEALCEAGYVKRAPARPVLGQCNGIGNLANNVLSYKVFAHG